MTKDLMPLLEQLQEQGEKLKETISQSRGLLREFRLIMQEAQAVKADLPKLTEKAVDEQIAKYIKEGLDEYAEVLEEAIDKATNAVYRRFDTLTSILLGEDKESRTRAQPTLEQLIRSRKDRNVLKKGI
ncbi:MAG: hypothetical protein ACRD8U_05550 [Pyrinomonadaceae bacterium]